MYANALRDTTDPSALFVRLKFGKRWAFDEEKNTVTIFVVSDPFMQLTVPPNDPMVDPICLSMIG